MATNFYKTGGSYYTADTNKKIADIPSLQAYAKAGGKEITAPTPASGSVAIPNPTSIPNYNVTNNIGGTLYGTPKVPDVISSDTFKSGGASKLSEMKALSIQEQAQQMQDKTQQDFSTFQNNINELANQIKSTYTPSQDELNLRTDLANKQTEATNLKSSYNQGMNAVEDKVIPMEFITGQQASMQRQYNTQAQTLNDQQTNLINRLNLSQQDRTAIREGLMGQQDLQFKLQNAVQQNAQNVLTQARQLSTDAQNKLTTVISSLQGIDPSTLTPQQVASITEMSTQAGIPAGLMISALQQAHDAAVLKQSSSLDTLLTPTEAAKLGVPYGTTRGQAAKGNITPSTGRTSSTKKTSSGATTLPQGSTSSISPLAKDVYNNPALLNNMTPTEKGRILKELSNAGLDLKNFGLEKISTAGRETIAQYDDLKRQAQSAIAKLDAGLDVGPIASRVKAGQAMFGGAKEFTEYRSVIDNMSSALLKLRSGSAVTPQEFERIAGFIPSINDDEKTAKTKISSFVNEITSVQSNYAKRMTQSTLELIKPSNNDPLGLR